jgi:hypothetical protein
MPPVTRSATSHKEVLPLLDGWKDNNTAGAQMDPTTASTTRRRRAARKNADGSDIPPTYTIDLSLPPGQRYVAMAKDFQAQIQDLTPLFDEVVESFGINVSVETVKRIARLFLRRVHDSEQTAELRGIAKATGVEMYLLVSFNVLLDLFMGCTSGGVRVFDQGNTKMLHFRTLDWSMEVLRRVVVQLEFVDEPGGEVIARSVTYVGFVGILTGVR